MLLCRFCKFSFRLCECAARESIWSLNPRMSFRIRSKLPSASISSPFLSLFNSLRLKSSICSSSRLTSPDLLDAFFSRRRRRALASASVNSNFSFKVSSSLCNRTFSQSVSFVEEKSVPELAPIGDGKYRQTDTWSCLRRLRVLKDTQTRNHPFSMMWWSPTRLYHGVVV